jgi:hypothetical protein
MAESQMPTHLKEISSPAGMSNFDGEIDEGVEEALKRGDVYTHHAAWDFNGLVWYDTEREVFIEEIWRYQMPVGTYEAPDLRELMRLTNDDWGWS